MYFACLCEHTTPRPPRARQVRPPSLPISSGKVELWRRPGSLAAQTKDLRFRKMSSSGDYLEDNTEELKEFVRSTHLRKFCFLMSIPVQKLLQWIMMVVVVSWIYLTISTSLASKTLFCISFHKNCQHHYKPYHNHT